MIFLQTAKYLSILSTLSLLIINFIMYLHFVREGARTLMRVHVYRGQRPTLAESILSCHLWDIGSGLRLSGLCINASLYHLTAPRLAFLKKFVCESDYICMCTTCGDWKRAIKFLGSGVPGPCELPDLGAGNQTWAL